jgi:hypothetical protein
MLISPARKIRLFLGASVSVPPRQDPPTSHYGLRTDRNLALLDPDVFLNSLPDCYGITEMGMLLR